MNITQATDSGLSRTELQHPGQIGRRISFPVQAKYFAKSVLSLLQHRRRHLHAADRAPPSCLNFRTASQVLEVRQRKMAEK
ncbi:hypothetical protein GDO81_027987 [Engystomops pustulosus]|uniref:Uncharacterized protein n=1 Tax=Engystomops pustulosus TaxID=76066 RepID=A0AAV6YK81_ENGPU|nr:hypothetical protein GDO81_027987 [Engystomops pustulosus]